MARWPVKLDTTAVGPLRWRQQRKDSTVKTSKKVTAAAALALGVTVTSCGGGDTPTPEPTPETTTPIVAPTAAAKPSTNPTPIADGIKADFEEEKLDRTVTRDDMIAMGVTDEFFMDMAISLGLTPGEAAVAWEDARHTIENADAMINIVGEESACLEYLVETDFELYEVEVDKWIESEVGEWEMPQECESL